MNDGGPLPSWNEGAAKTAIITFVEQVVASDVPVEERIATFDADGTLWCEKPMPVQVDFILRRLAQMAEADAPLRDRQPWKAVHEHDQAWLGAAITEHYAGDDTKAKLLLGGVAQAFAGIGVEDLQAQSDAFLRGTRHPTLGRGYLAATYVPMLELLDHLKANGFINHIVSGSGRDFMRPISQETFGIPLERLIGSSGAVQYTSDDKGSRLTHAAGIDFLDDGPEKPIQIWSHIGRRPLLAGGNSNGDVPMLEFAERPGRPSFGLLVLHDDAEREFAYTGGAEKALAAAAKRGWTVVSMKDDWSTVFAAHDGASPAH